jgi:STIP1 family protein 1
MIDQVVWIICKTLIRLFLFQQIYYLLFVSSHLDYIPKHSTMTSTTSSTAAEYKEQGNKYFQVHRFEEAITSYSKAIIKNPNTPTFFTNRALCYLHMKQWEKAADDCRKALELDRKSVKANFFLGRACAHLQQFDESIKLLTR